MVASEVAVARVYHDTWLKLADMPEQERAEYLTKWEAKAEQQLNRFDPLSDKHRKMIAFYAALKEWATILEERYAAANLVEVGSAVSRQLRYLYTEQEQP